MKQAQDVLTIRTHHQGHHDITGEIDAWLEKQKVTTGLVIMLIQHVLASMTIRNKSDRDDLHALFKQFESGQSLPGQSAVPLYSTQLSIPVRGGKMALGPRQAVCVHEDRETGGQSRHIVVHFIGE
ncbi:MAG: YjbQ family protein [Rhodospirillales bacterium]|nr:YjbQ family protein [Rhodospirillales bacterium]